MRRRVHKILTFNFVMLLVVSGLLVMTGEEAKEEGGEEVSESVRTPRYQGIHD